MKNYLALHAHFYQPHTQDLWLGDYIEDSWVKKTRRMSKACYGANSASRIIGADGRIQTIINNFSLYSFSFDPQLLEALSKMAPNVYTRVLEADKQSLDRYDGFGNALAQPYNHTILPLATKKERTLQIGWGIASFEEHFSRKPLGMWLPEMAVNFDVIDDLINHGIEFILLSPFQGQAISRIGSGHFLDLFGKAAPSNRPFRVDRPHGNINVFFYNPTLTDGIYFHHWLRDADNLFGALQGLKGDPETGTLVNAVTMGDIYGYREPFGDMCIAALEKKISQSKDWEFTNFGKFLKENPPTELVKLSRGPEEKGTSWACPHGVARWERDCGCRSHSNHPSSPHWKAPLRNHLGKVWDQVIESFEEKIGPLEDNLVAIQKYLKIRITEPVPGKFLGEFFPKVKEEEEKTRILAHFEAILTGQEMFSSGGWFVDSLHSPGAIHTLMSAQRTLELLQPYTNEDMEFHYQEQLRGIPGQGEKDSAWDIYAGETRETQKGPALPAAIFLMDELLPIKHKNPEIGPYRRLEFSKKKKEVSSQIFEFTGSIQLMDRTTLRKYHFEYNLVEDLIEGISLHLRDLKIADSAPFPVNLQTLPELEKSEIAKFFTRELENNMVSQGQKIFPELKKAIAYSAMLGVAPPPVIKNVVEIGIIRSIFSIKPREDGTLSEENLGELDGLLSFVRENELSIPEEGIRSSFTRWIAEVLINKDSFTNREVVIYLDRLLQTARKAKIEPDITVAQTMVYEIVLETVEGLLYKLDHEDIHSLEKLRCLAKLGQIFAIDLDFIKDRVLEFCHDEDESGICLEN